jgi:hypothetical protein
MSSAPWKLIIAVLAIAIARFAVCAPSEEGVPISITRAIEIANGAMRELVEAPNELQAVSATIHSGPSNEVVDKIVDKALKKRLSEKLNARNYWAVQFRRRDAMFGGGVAMFVDATTGDLIQSYRSR